MIRLVVWASAEVSLAQWQAIDLRRLSPVHHGGDEIHFEYPAVEKPAITGASSNHLVASAQLLVAVIV
ncbi:hypothetical protein [Pseudomonas saliphila]|uniref:hypothetical protein n=1 Tax=Pseudomonas saliphila TaxID=2586906 RepID=UPI00123C24CD|nr:hypothetical protein [Pseudomonas saliphila]